MKTIAIAILIMVIIAVGKLIYMLYGVEALPAIMVMGWLIIFNTILTVLTVYFLILSWKSK